MTEIQLRSFEPHLEVRTGGKFAGRTVFGVAVPYNTPQFIDESLTEQFARGAFAHQLRAANRVPFAREHMALGGKLIGRAVSLTETDDALEGEFLVSQTELGKETLELIRDGALSHLSVGFRARTSRKLPNNVVERVKADLMEVSVVLQGAYGDNAAVSGVRSGEGDNVAEEWVTSTPNLENLRAILARL